MNYRISSIGMIIPKIEAPCKDNLVVISEFLYFLNEVLLEFYVEPGIVKTNIRTS